MSRQTKQTKQIATNIVETKTDVAMEEISNDKVVSDVSREKNMIARIIENCLDELYAQGITGLKALHNLAYLIILKFIEPHIGHEIDIDNFNFPNMHDLSPEQFQTRRNRLMDLVRFSNLAKEPEQNLLSVTEALWEEVLSEHPITSTIFQKGKWFDIPKPDPNKKKDQLRGITLLKKLIDKINSIPHTEVDVLGHAYEHVANKNGGQTLGQFFTQTLIKDLMIDIINPQILPDGHIESCCDPTMGSAGFLSTYVKYITNQANIRKLKIDWIKNKGKIYGKEIESDTFHLAVANMLLSTGHIFEHLEHGDSINAPITEKFDTVLANPPFGIKIFKYDTISCKNKEEYFPIAIDNAICLFLQTIIHMLKINGRAAIVLPRGRELFGEPFKNIRQLLMKTCEVKEIINLPPDAFTNTSVKTCVIYFIKKRESSEVLSKVNTTKTRSKRATYEYKFIDPYETKSVKFYEYCKEEKGNKRLIMEVPLEDLIKKHLSLEISKYIKQEKENYGTGIVTKKLGEIYGLYAGSYNSSDCKSIGKYPFYTGKANNPEGFSDNFCFDYDHYLIITKGGGAGDGKYGEHIGLGKVFRTSGKTAAATSQLAIVSRDNTCNVDYLYHYLWSIKNKIMDMAHYTTGLGNIRKSDLENMEIPVPPIGWQKNIVDYLDFLELSNQFYMKEIEMRQNLIGQHIKSYTNLHVNHRKLGEICDLSTKGNVNSNSITNTGEYPFYNASVSNPNGTHNTFCFDGVEYILFVKSGGNAKNPLSYTHGLGKVYLSAGKTVGTTEVVQIKFNETYGMTKYLYYFLRVNQLEIQKYAHYTTGLGHINMKEFTVMEIPIPTIEDQKIIVDYCENQDKKIAELKQEIEQNKLMAKDHITRVLKACEKTEQDEPEPEVPQQVETKTEPTEEVKINGSHPSSRSKKVVDPAAPKKSRSKKAQPIQKIVIESDREDEDS